MKPTFDLSPRSLAARFGQVAITRILDGRDPYEAARLAGSYAREVVRGHDDDHDEHRRRFGAPSTSTQSQVAQPRTGDR